jgi:hypothetical protein
MTLFFSAERFSIARNRLFACKLASVRPRFREFKPNGNSPLAWVISQNFHRRQFTASQKTIVVLEAEPMFAKELKAAFTGQLV